MWNVYDGKLVLVLSNLIVTQTSFCLKPAFFGKESGFTEIRILKKASRNFLYVFEPDFPHQNVKCL